MTASCRLAAIIDDDAGRMSLAGQGTKSLRDSSLRPRGSSSGAATGIEILGSGTGRAEALCGYPEGSHSQLQAVCCVSQSIPRRGDHRGHPPVPVALGRGRGEHLQHDRAAVLVPRHLAATGSGDRGRSHPRAPEDTAGDEPRRAAAPARRRRQPKEPLQKRSASDRDIICGEVNWRA